MKKYKRMGLCFMMCLLFTSIHQVQAASVTTDDGYYTFDRDYGRITGYNPNNLPDAPKEVIIPNTVTVSGVQYNVIELGNGAFDMDDNVTKVVIADSVTKLSGAFDGCPDLKEIILGKGISNLSVQIGAYLPSLTSFTIPGSVKILSKTMPFEGCDNLIEMIFEEGFESIPTEKIDGFSSLTNLQRIVLPSTLKNIHENAFGNNGGITEITIAQNEQASPLAASQPWGAINARVTWTNGSSTTTSSSDVKVYYDPSNKIADANNPLDAQWSVVIPKSLNFSQQPNGQKIDANVILKSENGIALPSGKDAVDVSVSSRNGYLLKYGIDHVSYELTYADEFGTNGTLKESSGTKKLKIGTLQNGKTMITSSAEVKGIPTLMATYSDTLTYTVEKVVLP